MGLSARIGRRLAVAAALAGLVLATAGLPSGSAPALAAVAPVRVLHATTADGSRILVEVPAAWNGTLALYSHGYRPPVGGDTTAADASTRGTAAALLASGYALAGSSYPRNGWAVAEGVRADELLLRWFDRHVGTPHRLYVWGDSLGGLVTETFAEAHPDLVTATAPMCGVLAGANLNLDEALDAAVAIKTLLYPKLKLRNFTSYAQAQAQFDAVMAAVQKGLASADPSVQARYASRALAVAAIADAPHKSQHYDGSGLAGAVGAAVEGIGYGMFYGTVGRYDIERRVGGDPSGNLGVDYRDRISTADLRPWEKLGLSAGLLRSYAAEVQALGARLRPDAAARARFGRLGNPTGDLARPTITMHTTNDPLVLVQNERVFAHRVAARHRSGRLLQLYVAPPASYPTVPGAPYGAGHCNFADGDRVGLIRALDTWVSSGQRPTLAQVATMFPHRPAGQGGLLTGDWRPPSWPAR